MYKRALCIIFLGINSLFVWYVLTFEIQYVLPYDTICNMKIVAHFMNTIIKKTAKYDLTLMLNSFDVSSTFSWNRLLIL